MRERVLQVAVGLLGLLYVAMIYPLYRDLAHSNWLLVMNNECDPMFLSWFVTLGPFLLLAARKPLAHRYLILFAGWQCLVHASVMAIQTAQAWKHGVHRHYMDVIVVGLIGVILLILLPAREHQSATVPS
jgi:membrane-bound acyltransferase YfiQ involved in biofilm formation